MARSRKGELKHTNKYSCIADNHLDYRPIYRVWNTMIRRCTNPKSDMYYRYGGRGIKVCDRWLNKTDGFINFYNDMGDRPVDENGRPYQIDRIDNDKGYSPDNCKWTSALDNARNKSNNIEILIYGDRYCVNEACKMFGVKRTTVTENIRVRHKTPTDAFADALERRML